MYFTLKEPNKDNETIIYIRYYVKKENNYFKISSGLSIHPKDWSKENRLPRLKRGGDSYKNRRITEELIKLNEKLNKAIDSHGSDLTIGHLKQHFNPNKETENKYVYIEDYFTAFIDEKIKVQQVGKPAIQKYKVVLSKILSFQEFTNKKYTLTDFNDTFFQDFIAFLRTEHDLYDNTLHRYINFFKTCLIWCTRKGYKINNDYKNISIKRHETNDVHLTEEELKLLEEVELTGSKEKARDLFLIGAYTGQRFSDYSIFERADVREGAIVKKAKKTKVTSFIPLHSKLQKLLDKYEWKLPKISSQKFNIRIQQICKELKINDSIKKVSYMGKNVKEEIFPKWKLIGSHTARRTFITLMSERGMPDHQLMQIAGIKDAKTLQKYKKFNLNTLINNSNKLWDY
jgi:integrase